LPYVKHKKKEKRKKKMLFKTTHVSFVQ